MKNQPLTALLLCVTFFANAQNQPFDGQIVYTNIFSLPNGKKVAGIFPKQMGVQQKYYTKSNYYKSFLQAESMTMQLYNEADNTYYMVLPDNTDELVNSSLKIAGIATVPTSTGASTPEAPTTAAYTILGYTCKRLIMTEKSNKITYYFSDELKVSPDILSKQNFGSWNNYMNISNGALPLKFVIENPQYVWTVEAIRLEPKK